MAEHYCDCCGHVHGDLEAHEKIAQLEADLELLKAVPCAHCLTRICELEAENERVRDAIQTVLDDEETRDGGWGPDVTMVSILKDALKATADELTDE